MNSSKIKSLCVFCGSSVGLSEAYSNAAILMAKELVKRKIHLVYGAGSVGLMGVLADAIIENGGSVTGVVPHFLDKREVVHRNLNELILIDTMAERKQILMERSDAFIALPGGLGTFDELFEVATAVQLEQISKPIGVLNVNGYFDPLLAMLDKAAQERFMRVEHRDFIMDDNNPSFLLDKLMSFRPPPIGKWIDELKQKKHY